MDINIRELRSGDFDYIASAKGGAWRADSDLWNRYLQEHLDSRRVVLLAFDEEDAVGYGTLVWLSSYSPFRDAEVPEVNNLVVAPQVQRRGIATRLIAEFERRAREAGSKFLGLGVGLYTDYGAAQSLYIKLGFRPDGNGMTYRGENVRPGSTVPVDDDLLLWLTKAL